MSRHWRKRCRRVLDDEAHRRLLRERGLAQAGRFSWQKTARRTAEAYRSLRNPVTGQSSVDVLRAWYYD